MARTSLHAYRPAPPADAFGIEALRTELNILTILHTGGCGDRVIKPLATVRWPGQWWDEPKERARRWFQVGLAPAAALPPDPAASIQQLLLLGSGTACQHCVAANCLEPWPLQPTHAYVMPAYERGSVTKILKDICNR